MNQGWFHLRHPQEQVLDRLTQLSEHALSRLKVRSALTSCLWMEALTLPFGFGAVLFGDSLAQIVGTVAIFAPMLIYGIGFLYLLRKNPDKLRSEEYELRKMALTLIEEKGGAVPISAVSLEVISNPAYEALPHHPEDTGEHR